MNRPPVDAQFLDFARELASCSAKVIKPYYGRRDLRVESKSDKSPVTEADRKAEEAMRRLIRQRYPSHGILGEEFGQEREDAEYVWVLDPIDGTVSFANHCPLFGTLIGLLHAGKPVLGAIHQPLIGQLCIGTEGGTRLNGTPARLRPTTALQEAVVLTTDLANVKRYQDWQKFERLISMGKLFRTWGDCYGYLLLTAGGADVMADPIMHAWDLLPLIPIIRGAGGTITGWAGEDPTTATSCVAASADLHARVLEILNA